MPFDPSSFHLANVTDTCAVWNVVSSSTLFAAARSARVEFICTGFVIYECLVKPRRVLTAQDSELQGRLRAARQKGAFISYPLDLADLQTLEILENRQRLGKGELSAIAFASKVRQAFLTDDRKAQNLARAVLGDIPTQTTPHMVAWLFFHNRLTDGDKNAIVKEHTEMNRPLSSQFDEAYMEACRCRLMTN